MPTSFGESFPYNKIQQAPSEAGAVLPLHHIPRQVELGQLNPTYKDSQRAGFIEESEKEQASHGAPTSLVKARAGSSLDPQKSPFDSSPTSQSRLHDPQMGRKPANSRTEVPERPTSTASGGQNGYVNGNMESHLEMRRKHPSLEYPTAASQTAHLMGREGFSLDDQPPPTPLTPNPNTSFFDLPRQDRRNFLLLVLLYFLQGIPMGLASGSVPFLLKSHLSYGQIGVFSLASYPYSLKLLWSPIVDAVWSPALGRRKSWIMPIQVCSGLGMIYLGGRIKEMMVAAGANDGSGVWSFTWWWFFLVFLCATQDIAVDGTQVCPLYVFLEANNLHRLGPYAAFASKPLLCLHRSNRRAHRWPFSLLHRLPGLQLARLCQSMVSLYPKRRGRYDPRWLPYILGLGIPSSDLRPRPSKAGR